MKLQLPTVTAICVDCVNANRAIKVLEHCKSLCDFGAVKLLTHIPTKYEHLVKIKPLNSLISYSIFMLKEIHKHIDTQHLLVVQRDGFILNTSAWDENWLSYDYIAPLFVQYDRVGSGGFSLRSKRIMKHMADIISDWDGTDKHAHEIQSGLSYYEDGMISLTGLQEKFKFPSNEEASRFAQGGNRNHNYHVDYPFGFHGVWNAIDHATGKVSPVCEHEKGNCECVEPHRLHLYENEK